MTVLASIVFHARPAASRVKPAKTLLSILGLQACILHVYFGGQGLRYASLWPLRKFVPAVSAQL